MSTSPFSAAIDSFDIHELEKVITAGADVNAPLDHAPWEGITPLWLAAERNERSMVELLLAAGADPNRPERELPHFRTYQEPIVRALLDAGARIDARNPEGYDLLQHCASKKPQYGSYYAPIARLALERGADPEATAGDGRTALQIAIAGESWAVAGAIHGPRLVTGKYASPFEEAIAVWDDDWAQEEAANVEVAARYDSGAFGSAITPLHAACKGNHLAAVRALLDRGADPNVLGGDGAPPLLLTNRFDIVQLLAERGADLGARDAYGRNLLMLAAENEQWNEQYVDMAKLALERGVDPHLRSAAGDTALRIALANRGKKVAALIRGPLSLQQLLAKVSEALLHGRPPPQILAALWGEQFQSGESLLSDIGESELVSDPEQLGLESYLAPGPEQERWKARIGELAFFAVEADGGALAFWLEEPGLPLDRSPVVILDNEGSLRRGAASLADYLALGHSDRSGKSGLAKVRKWLKKLGIEHNTPPSEMEAARDALPDPET